MGRYPAHAGAEAKDASGQGIIVERLGERAVVTSSSSRLGPPKAQEVTRGVERGQP